MRIQFYVLCVRWSPSNFSMVVMLFRARLRYSSFFRRLTFSTDSINGTNWTMLQLLSTKQTARCLTVEAHHVIFTTKGHKCCNLKCSPILEMRLPCKYRIFKSRHHLSRCSILQNKSTALWLPPGMWCSALQHVYTTLYNTNCPSRPPSLWHSHCAS